MPGPTYLQQQRQTPTLGPPASEALVRIVHLVSATLPSPRRSKLVCWGRRRVRNCSNSSWRSRRQAHQSASTSRRRSKARSRSLNKGATLRWVTWQEAISTRARRRRRRRARSSVSSRASTRQREAIAAQTRTSGRPSQRI